MGYVSHDEKENFENCAGTLCNLLSSVDLGNLFIQKLVTLLADGDDLLSSNTKCRNSLQTLLGDNGSALVLGKSIGIAQGVVYLLINQRVFFTRVAIVVAQRLCWRMAG